MTTLWTIGHSTRTVEEFIDALKSFQIEILVDIRRFPTSRRHPQFITDALKRSLHAAGIRYEYLGDELGGYRKGAKDSPHVGLGDSAFRAFADWTAAPLFRKGVEKLLALAAASRTAIMCAERAPASCHRRILCDYLALVEGIEVVHVLDPSGAVVHECAPSARRVAGTLRYLGPQTSLDENSPPSRASHP